MTSDKDNSSSNLTVDPVMTVYDYISKMDWRVNANANQGYSLGGLILNSFGKIAANFSLSQVFPEAAEAHKQGDIHIHDLDMISGYCAGWSLRALLEEGFNGVDGKVESGPPKHLSSALAQMVNFLGTLQNEWAGAQAFSGFDTYLAPFVRKYALEKESELRLSGAFIDDLNALAEYIKKDTERYVYQQIQSFVFNLNTPSRWGTQTPFTNITLDLTVPEDLRDKRLLLDGREFSYTYGELTEEMDLINRVFVDIMTKGDWRGRAFTFPIPTYNITKDFDWDNPKNLPIFAMAAKYGTPYFQNFVNSDLSPKDVRSMCCRLQLNMKELRHRGGGLFGSSEMTGSIGVVTINAARIGWNFKGDKEKFLRRVGELMELGRLTLERKRVLVQKLIDGGLFPYTKRYLGYLRNHFSTIGINGLNEAIRNFTDDKEDITTDYGQKFAAEVLDFMNEKLKIFQEETKNLYNLEATPAEGATYRFAKEDAKRYKGIIQAGTKEAPYYTNSSQLPVGYTTDIFEALDLQDMLQKKYTGGTVFHCYLSERVSSPEACRSLVKGIVENYRLPYITITPTFSICKKHGYLSGEHDWCPKCDEEIGLKEIATIDLSLREKHSV